MRFAATFAAIAMSISTAHAATLTTLFSFNGQNGSFPQGSLITDASGNLFGTTQLGGTLDLGTVFRLDTMGNLTTLASFNGLNGVRPSSGVIADASGNLFGTTEEGGAFGRGTVFRIDKSGSLTTLVNFNELNGSFPLTGLVADASGNLFGTTAAGGLGRAGTIFKLDAGGALTTLVNFGNFINPGPRISLIDESGNLFGTTSFGGGFFDGTIFKLDTAGALTTLFTFNGQNGANPVGDILADASGNLFGATSEGGAFGAGTVFKFDRTGAFSTLFNFDNQQDGGFPFAGLLLDESGNLFGTTGSGGAGGGGGTVFRLDASGTLRTIVTFNGQNGDFPRGGLIADASGNLFGTTFLGGTFGLGTVFRISNVDDAAAVPEPATWAMMLFGFGFVGAGLRRRQSRSAMAPA